MPPVSRVLEPFPGHWSALRRRKHGAHMSTSSPDLHVGGLEWVSERTNEAMVVRPVGEVNAAAIPVLWSNLRALREDHLNVIVDLKAIPRVDPDGMRALLDMHQLFIQRGQRLAFAAPSPVVRALLEAEGHEQAMPIFVSVAAALATFRSPARAVS